MLDHYGIGDVAAANDIIVLFPEGDKSGGTNCWEGDAEDDGYTGTDAWSHDGVQQKAILQMIERLKESASDGLEDLQNRSWNMPLGWFDARGFFEETSNW